MQIREEFKRRANEINSFYEILEIIELDNPHITALDKEVFKEKKIIINNSKIDILRSTTYLLLYNLIESTVYNCIISIFDQINDSQIKYFEVVEEVQKYWLKNLYKHNNKGKETIITTIMDVAVRIFNDTISLVSNQINYGGSLDAKSIFKTAKSMKIDISNLRKVYKENKHGQVLLDIKNKRNWLAHGEKSFTEVGSSCLPTQLKETKEYVFQFLEEFITSIENYLRHEQYKSQNF